MEQHGDPSGDQEQRRGGQGQRGQQHADPGDLVARHGQQGQHAQKHAQSSRHQTAQPLPTSMEQVR